MGRNKGSKDLKPRRKRKLYGGKPIRGKRRNRGGNFVPYVSKRGRDDPLRVRFQEKKPMSIEGYRRWNRKVRIHVDRIIRPFIKGVFLVEPEMLSTTEAIGETAMNVLQYSGNFNLLMPSASKSSFRVSYKKKASIKITESEEGLHAEVYDLAGIKRYWFWRG